MIYCIPVDETQLHYSVKPDLSNWITLSTYECSVLALISYTTSYVSCRQSPQRSTAHSQTRWFCSCGTPRHPRL